MLLFMLVVENRVFVGNFTVDNQAVYELPSYIFPRPSYTFLRPSYTLALICGFSIQI